MTIIFLNNVKVAYAGLNLPILFILSLLFHKQYAADIPRPTAPPIPHFLRPAVKTN